VQRVRSLKGARARELAHDLCGRFIYRHIGPFGVSTLTRIPDRTRFRSEPRSAHAGFADSPDRFAFRNRARSSDGFDAAARNAGTETRLLKTLRRDDRAIAMPRFPPRREAAR